MPTINESLTQLKHRQSELASALTGLGVKTDNSETLYEQINKVRVLDIGEKASGWQPSSDWLDIKSIVDGNINEGFGSLSKDELQDVVDANLIRYAYIVSDSNKTITLSAHTEPSSRVIYFLSDGSVHELTEGDTPIIHEWDTSQDKPCSGGYGTRAVLVMTSYTLNVSVIQKSYAISGIDSLYLYFGNCNITSMAFNSGLSNAQSNTTLQAVVCNNKTTMSASALVTYSFSSCTALEYVVLAPGLTTLPAYCFYQSNALKKVLLPDTLTSLDKSPTLSFLSNLGNLVIPSSVQNMKETAITDLIGLKTITINSNFPKFSSPYVNLANMISLLTVNIPKDFNISIRGLNNSPNLSIVTLRNMIENYADRKGLSSITLAIGSVNIAKLSNEYINLAKNKNITLA